MNGEAIAAVVYAVRSWQSGGQERRKQKRTSNSFLLCLFDTLDL